MGRTPVQLEVVRAPAERVEDAMGALLGAGPAAAERFVRQAAGAAISLEHAFCLADPFGRYRMAVLAVPSAGRAAMLLASHARHRDDVADLGRAVEAACRSAAGFADIAQALVEPHRELDVAAFEAGGLRNLATLEYLEAPLRSTAAPRLPDGWTIEPVAPALVLDGSDVHRIAAETRAELACVLEASYRDTLDCPGLAGLRHTADVVEGHFAIGARRRFWLFARERGVARGVCLLNATPDGRSVELVYFGLAPEARGRGLGAALLDAGFHAAAQARCATASLAVDMRNAPARKLYDSRGFRQISSRVALVRDLRPLRG
jgi:ribosomal protein S18 acetylase RimI-like enzyme